MQNVGIVLELEEDYAIVMRQDGLFTRLRRTSDMEVGVEIAWQTRAAASVSTSGRRRRHAWMGSRWRRVGTAGIAACLVVAAGVWFATNALSPTQAQAYAFISLDINPSISIQVDKHLVVQNADGINADGKSLLQHLTLQGKPLKTAVSLIVSNALQNHMIPANDTILISTAPSSPGSNVATVQQEVESTVKATIDSSPAAKSLHPNVHALGLSSAVWEAANTAKLSPGKLAAYLMAAQEGVHVTDVNQLTGPQLEKVLSDANAASVSQILKANNPNQVTKFIQSLQSSGLLTAVTDDGSSQPSTQSGDSNTKSKANGGHGQSAGTSTDKHAQSGVTIELGGSKLTVPTGGEHPFVQFPLTTHSDQAGEHGNQGQDSADEDHTGGRGQGYTGHGHGNDGEDGNGHGKGQGNKKYSYSDQDGVGLIFTDNSLFSSLTAVLQSLR